MMKFCSNCGKPNQDDFRFCSNCGTRLEENQADPAVSDGQRLIPPASSQEDSSQSDRSEVSEETDGSAPRDFEPAAGGTPSLLLQNQAARMDIDRNIDADVKEENANQDCGPDSFSFALSCPNEKKQEAPAGASLDETPAEGMQIGFVRPTVIEAPVSSPEKSEEPTESSLTSPSSPAVSENGRPVLQRSRRHGLSMQEKPDPEEEKQNPEDPSSSPQDPQKKWLIVAVSILGVAAVFLLCLLLYQNFYLPARQIREQAIQEGTQLMSEMEPLEEDPKQQTEDGPAPEDSQSGDLFYFSSSEYREKHKNDTPSDFEDEESEGSPEDDDQEAENSASSLTGTDYQTNFVMKIREKPSLEAEQTGRVPQGQSVVIDRTQAQADGSLWGHLANDKGWICIHDSEQEYLTKK